MIKHNFTNKDSKKDEKKEDKEKKPSKPALKDFTYEDLEYLTTPILAEVVTADYANTYIITGKAYGKNRAVGLRIIKDLEHDTAANAVALKKYKTNAGQRLHQTIFNLYMELKMLGYDVKNYRKGQGETFREKYKDNSKNQTIEYASAEKTDELSGIEAKNLGYYAVAWFDEPVISEDNPDKIPSKEDWEKFIDIFMDSVSRSNTNRERTLRMKDPNNFQEVPMTNYFYTMNPWDLHPIIVEANELAPEKDFYRFVKKDVIENHSKLYQFPAISKQILRGTKFGNPIIYHMERMFRALGVKKAADFTDELKQQIDWEDPIFIKYNITPKIIAKHFSNNKGVALYVQAEKAIKEKNKVELARILGLSFDGDVKYTKTYNLQMLQTADTDLILKNPMTKAKMVGAWDIDSRAKEGRYVFTPVYLVYNNNLKSIGSSKTIDGKPIRTVKNIVVGKQVSIPAGAGLGDRGQRKPKYIAKIIAVMNLSLAKFKKFGKHDGEKMFCAFDDNAKSFVTSVSDSMSDKFLVKTTKYKNTKNWQIKARERWLQTAIDTGMLIMDKDNKGLINDLEKSFIKEGGTQRYESGRPQDYDKINSMEYALYFFRREIVPNIKPGCPADYIKEE